MDKQIVFIDIDGTLIDEQQRTNCDIVPVILNLQKRGVRFGLNSNRAWEDVEPIVGRFHFDGPFILENGAYYKETAATEPVPCAVLPTQVPQKVFHVVARVVQENFPNADVTVTDTTKTIFASESILEGQHFYINKFRKFSGSIHHRFNRESFIAVAQKLADEINKVFNAEKILLCATAHAHGATVTIDVPNISKGTGLLFVQKCYPTAQFIAIGDGSGDVAMRPFVNLLYAVANAVPPLKAVANAVASLPLTQGVKEILEKHFY